MQPTFFLLDHWLGDTICILGPVTTNKPSCILHVYTNYCYSICWLGAETEWVWKWASHLLFKRPWRSVHTTMSFKVARERGSESENTNMHFFLFVCSVLFFCFLSTHILYDWAMCVRERQTWSRSTRQDKQIHYVCLINNFLWEIDVFWLEQLFALTIVIPLTWYSCVVRELSFSACLCIIQCMCVWSGWVIHRAQTETPNTTSHFSEGSPTLEALAP